jgi:acetyl esterase/lipase
MEAWSIINPPEGSTERPTVDVSNIRRKYLDIPYASQSPSQKLDIYLPSEGDGPFPTLIFIHGGAFVFGDKRDLQFLHAIDGINRGYAVVSVEYRRAFEAQYPNPLFDIKAATRFLRANAATYKLDGNRFASGGDSAGGYYVVMAASTQGNPAFEDFSMGNAEYSSKVKAIISWYGAADLTARGKDKDIENTDLKDSELPDNDKLPDIYKLLLGAQMGEISGLMHFTNPLHFITPEFPPVFVQHGSDDRTVPVIHAYQLEEQVQKICGEGHATVDILNGYDHGTSGPKFQFMDPKWVNKEQIDKAFAFLDKYLK